MMKRTKGGSNWLRGVLVCAWAMMVSGGGLLAWFGWDAWQQTVGLNSRSLPVYQPVATRSAAPTPALTANLAGTPSASSAGKQPVLWTPPPQLGQKWAQLTIPRLGLSVPVVE
ncbi:MAG: hypothetical protein K6T26_08795, partial [Alicyclobacillus sp.]|nr:hypothetical protein [Alicyclobacillus sp.]